jgi:hypothetical protein
MPFLPLAGEAHRNHAEVSGMREAWVQPAQITPA